MSAGWIPVSRQQPCPICGKADWCGRTGDGVAVRCMRAQGIPVPSGWLLVKTDPDGGTVFIRQDDLDRRPPAVGPTREQTREGPDRHWTVRATNRAKEITPDQLRELADELGVTPASLGTIGVGWSGRLKAYTFPERDGEGQVVGIATRDAEGRKSFMAGGKRGLTIPDGLADLPDPVLIVEGPSDVAACLSLGLAAVGRPSNIGGVEHLTQLLAERDAFVVGEFDPKPNGSWPGRDGAQHVAAQLAQRWEKPVRWVLPPDNAKDIRSWFNAQHPDLSDDDKCLEAGRSLLEVLTQRAASIEPPADSDLGHPYRETERGLVYLKPTMDGDVPVQLTNFGARIIADVIRDDGQEQSRYFEVEAQTLCSANSIPADRGPGAPVLHLGVGLRSAGCPCHRIPGGDDKRQDASGDPASERGDCPPSRVYAHRLARPPGTRLGLSPPRRCTWRQRKRTRCAGGSAAPPGPIPAAKPTFGRRSYRGSLRKSELAASGARAPDVPPAGHVVALGSGAC